MCQTGAAWGPVGVKMGRLVSKWGSIGGVWCQNLASWEAGACSVKMGRAVSEWGVWCHRLRARPGPLLRRIQRPVLECLAFGVSGEG